MTLFKTADELIEILPNIKNLEFEKIAPYLQQAAEAVLAPQVGQSLLDRIQTKYVNTGQLSDTEMVLLARMRLIVSKIGLALYLPIGEVAIGNDGITVTAKSETRTAAYDYQVTKLTQSLLSQAHDALERMLNWLQVPAQLIAFPEYAGSDEYVKHQKGLIKRVAEFNDIYPIGSSRLTYQAIHPEILNVEEDILHPLIGYAAYNTIRSGIPLSDDYQILKRQAQKAVVFQAVANIIRLQQNIQLDASGLRVYGSSQAGSQNVTFYRAPTEQERLSAAAAAQGRADFYWDAVSTILAEIQNPGGDAFEGELYSTGKVVMF